MENNKQRRILSEQRIRVRFSDHEERRQFYNEMLEYFGKNGLKDISDKDFVEYVNRKLK